MQDWLRTRAECTPHKTALITPEYSWTFKHLSLVADDIIFHLQVEGVQPGDRVAVLLPNDVYYPAVVFGVLRMNAVLVPLNMRLTPDELRYQVEHTGCKLVIVDEMTQPQITELDLPQLYLDESLCCSWWSNLFHEADIDDPAAIIFTSGTMGKPKGAVLTLNNLYASAMASATHLGVLPDDRWLCVLPLYHVGGLSILIRSVLYGTAVELLPRFDLDAVNTALCEHPITLVSLVPTMLYRLLEEGTPERWQSSLRLILLGGAAATPQLLAKAAQYDLPVATTYGLTEAASQVATALPVEAAANPGTVGIPLMFTRIKLVDEQGKQVRRNDLGEILVKGPTVMQGYYNDEAATAEAIQDGWLYTGDVGYLDYYGELHVEHRRSDLIVTGGENVYPAEVEAVLLAHPAVDAVCVVGLEHPEWGQQVVAAVVVSELVILTDGAVAEDDLSQFCREVLAAYKVPRRYVFVDALPLTASGKIARHKVGELF